MEPVEELIKINDKLIQIVSDELDKKIVPSKEVLDTIKIIVAITCAIPSPME